MNADIPLLILAIGLGTLMFVVHVVNWLAGVRRGPTRTLRLLAWIPPLTPWVAWRAGYRVAPVLWGVSLIAYLSVRWVAGG